MLKERPLQVPVGDTQSKPSWLGTIVLAQHQPYRLGFRRGSTDRVNNVSGTDIASDSQGGVTNTQFRTLETVCPYRLVLRTPQIRLPVLRTPRRRSAKLLQRFPPTRGGTVQRPHEANRAKLWAAVCRPQTHPVPQY
jgi:hypothetical protein